MCFDGLRAGGEGLRFGETSPLLLCTAVLLTLSWLLRFELIFGREKVPYAELPVGFQSGFGVEPDM